MGLHQRRNSRLHATLVLAATVLLFATKVLGQSAPSSGSPQPPHPARPALYFFEHATLREAAFQYDQDIQRLIANPRQAGEPISRLFGKAVLRSAGMSTLDPQTAGQEIIGFMRQIGFETIRHGGYTIHLMRMPPPEHPNEAYFIAFAYKDGEPLVEGTPAPSTRYFTFEKTPVTGRACAMGEWDVNGRYKTLGFGNEEPTLRDVVTNVFAALGIQPN